MHLIAELLPCAVAGGLQGDALERYLSMTKRGGGGGWGSGLPLAEESSAGLKSALSGATDAFGSVQDAAGSAVSSLTEGAPARMMPLPLALACTVRPDGMSLALAAVGRMQFAFVLEQH
jgi:hypothetical protein